MKKSNLIFTEKNTGKIISGVITYETNAGETDCEWCPIRSQFSDNELCICSILDESLYTPPQVDGVSFRNHGNYFCNRVNIIAFNGITVDGIDHDKVDNFEVKYSLNDLLEKVCPGRCILLNNPLDCTREHRKCPGCILGELEKGGGGLNMERKMLKFKDKDGIERVLEIHFEMGNGTDCFDCPLSNLYPDIGPLSGNPTCSILAQRYDARMNTGDRFIDRNCDFYFCSKYTIVTAIEIESEEVEIELGESINRQKKVSLGDLIANVCPGRCVFMEDTSKCTEAHRKCPGCLLEDLNL